MTAFDNILLLFYYLTFNEFLVSKFSVKHLADINIIWSSHQFASQRVYSNAVTPS